MNLGKLIEKDLKRPKGYGSSTHEDSNKVVSFQATPNAEFRRRLRKYRTEDTKTYGIHIDAPMLIACDNPWLVDICWPIWARFPKELGTYTSIWLKVTMLGFKELIFSLPMPFVFVVVFVFGFCVVFYHL